MGNLSIAINGELATMASFGVGMPIISAHPPPQQYVPTADICSTLCICKMAGGGDPLANAFASSIIPRLWPKNSAPINTTIAPIRMGFLLLTAKNLVTFAFIINLCLSRSQPANGLRSRSTPWVVAYGRAWINFIIQKNAWA